LSQACAPAGGGGGNSTGRKKRSVEEDVHVVVLSHERFNLGSNEENMKRVEQHLKEFADKEGIAFKQLQTMDRLAENVGGKFGVHFEVGGAFDRCARVLQFIQAAVNELEELVSGTVKCGAFDAVYITKKH
ncbi:hypothetical protein PFISCL1PPCAC_23148, partial [Pristionchus fissidentatus]